MNLLNYQIVQNKIQNKLSSKMFHVQIFAVSRGVKSSPPNEPRTCASVKNENRGIFEQIRYVRKLFSGTRR